MRAAARLGGGARPDSAAAATFLALAGTLCAISGCAPATRHLVVPKPLIDSEALATTPPPAQVDDEVRFGKYRAAQVTRGPALRDGTQWLVLGRRTEAYQETSFFLEEEGGPARTVSCRVALQTRLAAGAAQASTAGAPPLSPSVTVLECTLLVSTALLSSARLHLEDGAGTLHLGRDSFGVAPATGSAGGDGPVGTVFSVEGEPVAAVQWVDEGGVWLARGTDGNVAAALAAAMAALLVVRGLR